MTIVLEPLGKQHDRSKFSCGQVELDDWFQHRAGQDDRRNIARVFVATDSELARDPEKWEPVFGKDHAQNNNLERDDDSKKNHPALGVVGFYSLSSFRLDLADLPQEIARKLPRYGGVPAALIGRLARDIRVRSKGVGELLVADALRRILSAARSLAVFAIVVDAKDERAATFYEALGFRRFPLRPSRLFLPASSAAKALEKM